MSTLADLDALLFDLFPVGSSDGAGQLDLVQRGEDEPPVFLFEPYPGHVRLSLRLIIWDGEEDSRSISNIKEQECFIVSSTHLDNPERVANYLRGWVDALDVVMSESISLDVVMPYELCHPRVLDLRIPRRPDQFSDALLKHSRLGKLLPHEGETGERLTGEELESWLAPLFPVEGPFHVVSLDEVFGGAFCDVQSWGARVGISLETRAGSAPPRPAVRTAIPLVRYRNMMQGERIHIYLQGWALALEEVLANANPGDQLRPWLLSCPDVLNLQSPATPGDFAQACLTRKRMGRAMRRAGDV